MVAVVKLVVMEWLRMKVKGKVFVFKKCSLQFSLRNLFFKQ